MTVERNLEAAYGARTVPAVRDFREFADVATRLVARGRAAYDQDEMLRLGQRRADGGAFPC